MVESAHSAGGSGFVGEHRITSRASSFEPPDRERRQRMIAEAAYHRAEQRNFEPGHELEDWLAAEREIDSLAINV
jgi:hypothetical protein